MHVKRMTPSANFSRGTYGNNLMYHMVIDAAGPSFETLYEDRSAPIEGSDEPLVVDEDQLYLETAGGLEKKQSYIWTRN